MFFHHLSKIILEIIYDGLVKSLERVSSVIPAQAGIQSF